MSAGLGPSEVHRSEYALALNSGTTGPMPSSTPLFVTGATRSGTSLLDKLLSSHEQMRVLSQPLPLVYVEAKRAYLHEHGGALPPAAIAYPLNDLFSENYLAPSRFTQHLHKTMLAPDWIADVFERMAHYEGQYFRSERPVETLVPRQPVSLESFVRTYLEVEAGPRRVIGSKEVFAEEFAPYFLECGWRVLLIVRDPRDVVASAFSGRGPELTGSGRPLLFVLRQWRKSVAFALEYRSNPHCRVIRYEDLVTRPLEVLDGVAEWLGCAPFDGSIETAELQSTAGEIWRSNSSHISVSRISRGSVGNYTERLAPPLSAAIEALCGPEMSRLGYAGHAPVHSEDIHRIVGGVEDPCTNPRAELSGYAWGPHLVSDETERLAGFETGRFSERLHLFPGAFEELRRFVAGATA